MNKQQLRFGVESLEKNLKNKNMTFIEKLQKRQNSSENVKMLAAQRRLYSKAKRKTLLIFILTVVVQVVLSILCTTIVSHRPKLSFLQDYFHMYTLIIIVVQYCLVRRVSKFKEEASHIQLRFDMRVFNLKWDDRFLGPDVDYDKLVERESNKVSVGYLKELKNWYKFNGLKATNKNQVIRFCQKQNLSWNSTLRKRVNNIIQRTMVINVFIYFVMLWLTKANVVQAMNILVNLAPLITWWITVNKNYDRDNKILDEFKRLLDNNKYSKTTSLLIEAKSTEYRKNSSLVPNCIYELFKKEDDIN